MAIGGRFRELLKKYGKVALGVHFGVSAASITGLYVAIRNNVDVEAVFDKVGLSSLSNKEEQERPADAAELGHFSDKDEFEHPRGGEYASDLAVEAKPPVPEQRNRTAERAASAGGALALAILCNKALFPVRVPITIALTPPVSRFLAKRGIIHY
ncbi:hypothetical protein H6P81_018661 [Aristolochia fimbriata]|uniref:DUF1279 domain-containing protein n=1 Tax=Aristolochia fimbriata TaxID=158543 RepID=A0AAV7E1Y6_ARIFI|nr:hypothetical protein H6P81_018661 [Aristolochia fimbriata]